MLLMLRHDTEFTAIDRIGQKIGKLTKLVIRAERISRVKETELGRICGKNLAESPYLAGGKTTGLKNLPGSQDPIFILRAFQ
jgi:hypothetical protein